ncbi:hypothetical protein [Pseudobutyrivibrio sp.]|uniref:hypothetical protein n=1 Tax=Pseudobutyrivibrio sp. TaxID=2014367 RepID=UPI0025F7A560|nr:hypothetical protein [Pseudobutyrivibrio sp.]MBR5648301.1 hypothetical protein [Pseudobutyrivibrio sp.]
MDKKEFPINTNKERYLAVLSSPKTLYDFLWIYLAYGSEFEWDLLALPAGKNSENGNWTVKIEECAKSSGIFKDVYIYQDALIDSSLFKKIKEFLSFFAYFLIRKQTLLSKKKIKEVINIDQYNNIVTVYQGTIFNGMIVSLSGEKNISLIEDGARSYVEHRRYPRMDAIRREGLELELAGFILSRMGYADVTIEYDFKPLYNCINYSARPDDLRYRKYREIRKMHDMNLVDKKVFANLIKKTFGIENMKEEYDAILFTSPIVFEYKVKNDISKNICDYISKKHLNGEICLKKHHRDNENYTFSNKIKCVKIASNIPAEIFISSIKTKMIYFMWPSTLISSLPSEINYKVLFDSSLSNDHYSQEHIEFAMKVIGLNSNNIIDIGKND